jgi:hypothetical protein
MGITDHSPASSVQSSLAPQLEDELKDPGRKYTNGMGITEHFLASSVQSNFAQQVESRKITDHFLASSVQSSFVQQLYYVLEDLGRNDTNEMGITEHSLASSVQSNSALRLENEPKDLGRKDTNEMGIMDHFLTSSVLSNSALQLEYPSISTWNLNMAIREGDARLVIKLIASGVDVNQPFTDRAITGLNIPEGYPLYHAVQVGEEMANILIEAGANVNAQHLSCGTALQNAARRGDYDTMKLLISAGADVNAKPGRDGTALIQAMCSRKDRLRKVSLLLRSGADVNAPSHAGNGTPFENALVIGEAGLIQALFAYGLNISVAAETWRMFRARLFPTVWLQLSLKAPYDSVAQLVADLDDTSATNAVRSIKLDWNVPTLLKPSSRPQTVSKSEEHPLLESFVGQFLLVDDGLTGAENSRIQGTTCTAAVHDSWGPNGVQLLRCIVNNILHCCPSTPQSMHPDI